MLGNTLDPNIHVTPLPDHQLPQPALLPPLKGFGTKDDPGVFGQVNDPQQAGVWGNGPTGVGVLGESSEGIGVLGRGNVMAGSFEGNVQITKKLIIKSLPTAEGDVVKTLQQILQKVSELEAIIASLSSQAKVTNFGEPLVPVSRRPLISAVPGRSSGSASSGSFLVPIIGTGFGSDVVFKVSLRSVHIAESSRYPQILSQHYDQVNQTWTLTLQFAVYTNDRVKIAISDGTTDVNDLTQILWSNTIEVDV